MSLRQMIELWKAGVEQGEKGNFEAAIKQFLEISEPGARIYFNISNMYLRLGKLVEAEQHLDICVKKDPNLAVGYFQRGCLHLLNRKNEIAITDFDLALKNLRGNFLIDYKQLGLMYKLYSCEVMYNRAYAIYSMGKHSEALTELENAKKIAVESSESRHQVISQALDQIKRGESFTPYRLPKSCMLFVPPRTKTDVLTNMDFLGQAKVVSSIVDQDDFTGFVGAQKQKEKEKSSSPLPNEHRSKTNLYVPKGDPSSQINELDKSSSPTQKPVTQRPPKPTTAPPPPRSSSRSPNNDLQGNFQKPVSRSPSPRSGAITVKIHYTTTRAVRVAKSISYSKLLSLICKKFEKADDSLTLWYKMGGGDDLLQVENDDMLNHALKDLEDGFRLTIWAYDKEETNDYENILKLVVAISDYVGQYSDELSFKSGSQIQVLKQINDDWYYGMCGVEVGIFPTSFVKDK